MTNKFKIGDNVSWNFIHGKIEGEVIEVIPATNEKNMEVRYTVKSNKSNKKAVHKESALKKID